LSLQGSDKAECYKAGYRRANTSHPTSYQTHFCRPWPGKLGSRTGGSSKNAAPLIEAAEQLDRGERSKPRQPRDSGAQGEHTHKQEVTVVARDGHQGGTKMSAPQGTASDGAFKVKRAQGPKCRRPLFVDPLPIPLADDEGTRRDPGNERKSKAHSSELRSKENEVKKRPTLMNAEEKHREKSSKGLPAPPKNQEQQGGEESSMKDKLSKKVYGKEERRKRRSYVSPLKKLYEEDRARHARAVGMFETEYKKHYKDWAGEAWHSKKKGGPQRSGEWGVAWEWSVCGIVGYLFIIIMVLQPKA